MPEAVALEPQVAPIAPPAESVPDAQDTTADSAPATTPEGEKPAATEKTDEQPAKSGESRFQRRLNKVYRKVGEEKARADFLQRQLDELKAQSAPKAAASDGAPRIEQFDDIEKWRAAVEKHASDKAVKDYEAKQRTTAQQQANTRLASEWEERVSAAEEKYEDFSDVVGDMKAVNPVTMAIMGAENGTDIAYYLGKNLKEAQALSALNPIAQMLAIGKLSERLATKPPEAKQPSKAPAPPTPITGKSVPASEALDDSDDMRTFIRKRNKQLGRTK